MTLALTVSEKTTLPFQGFSHVNGFGVKLDHAINWLDISGFKLFDTLMAFLIFFFLKKVNFLKKICKLQKFMQNYPTCKELNGPQREKT